MAPALIALAFVPIVAGAFRLLEVAGGPATLPAHPGIEASPVPIVVHIVSATLFTILGAFLFSPTFGGGGRPGIARLGALRWCWDWRSRSRQYG